MLAFVRRCRDMAFHRVAKWRTLCDEGSLRWERGSTRGETKRFGLLPSLLYVPRTLWKRYGFRMDYRRKRRNR